MNLKEYPFVRGTACDAPWDSVEKKPGVYDWSAMDQAVERAYKDKISLYFGFEAGPSTRTWVYEKGVPKVVTNDKRHKDKFPFYPYYLSPEYKTYYHRFLTEVAKHIASYPKEKRERIAFIQVKTGCTGDECPYKGDAVDSKYSLSPGDKAWKQFRLETFALYSKLFGQESPLKISLLLNGVAPDAEEGSKKDHVEEWNFRPCTERGAIILGDVEPGDVEAGLDAEGHPLVQHEVVPGHDVGILVRLQTDAVSGAVDEQVTESGLGQHVGDVPRRAERLIEVAQREPDLFAADVVVPVPLDKRRRRQRGYNQAELIARTYLCSIVSGVEPRTFWYDFRNDGTQFLVDPVVLTAEAAKHSVPDDQDPAVVTVEVTLVGTVVDAVVGRGVEDELD